MTAHKYNRLLVTRWIGGAHERVVYYDLKERQVCHCPDCPKKRHYIRVGGTTRRQEALEWLEA